MKNIDKNWQKLKIKWEKLKQFPEKLNTVSGKLVLYTICLIEKDWLTTFELQKVLGRNLQLFGHLERILVFQLALLRRDRLLGHPELWFRSLSLNSEQNFTLQNFENFKIFCAVASRLVDRAEFTAVLPDQKFQKSPKQVAAKIANFSPHFLTQI